MLARVSRARMAACPMPRVKAGITACCHEPQRATGSTPSCRASPHISSGPRVSAGTDTPDTAMNIAA